MKNYSLEMVGTVQACSTLLAQAQRRKQRLELKRLNLAHAIGNFRTQMEEIGREKDLTRQSLNAFTAACLAMPEGIHKANLVVKIKRLEIQQARLEKKAGDYQVPALLAKEFEYHLLDGKVSVMAQYIAALEARRDALSKPVNSETPALAGQPSATDVHVKVAEVIPVAATWRLVVDAFLSSGEEAPVMGGRQATNPVDVQLAVGAAMPGRGRPKVSGEAIPARLEYGPRLNAMDRKRRLARLPRQQALTCAAGALHGVDSGARSIGVTCPR